LFGEVTFKTKKPIWVRDDDITFIRGFNVNDIKKVHVSQLEGVRGIKKGDLSFHKRGHAQLMAVFEGLERLNLLTFITSCAGSLNFRLRKPVNGGLRKLPSNHAFGIALDLNSDDKELGASVAPVAPVFEAFGFKWGKSFNDPMHFEIDEFIDDPEAISVHLAEHLQH
jgi:hypothetical protein